MSDQLKQLAFFENFDELLQEMKELKEDEYSMYPRKHDMNIVSNTM